MATTERNRLQDTRLSASIIDQPESNSFRRVHHIVEEAILARLTR